MATKGPLREPSRRQVLAGLALVFGMSTGLAKQAGLTFGAAVRASDLRDTGLASLLRRHCRSFTPELELKWGWIEPTRGARNYAQTDAIAAFAGSTGATMRGHALLWHRSIPAWAEPLLVPGADWRLIAEPMAATMNRFAAAVGEWDVVNEPIEPQDGFGGLRVSPFYAAYGRNYIHRALEQARAIAPRAVLTINEYGLEYDTPAQDARRTALLALVRSLRAAQVPLDGIGLQTHLDLRSGPFVPAIYREFLARLAGEGLRLSITELDVKERDYPRSVADRDRMVADHAARVVEVAASQPALRSLTCWGLSDRSSWLTIEPSDYARFPDLWQDGTSPGLNRGLPFDAGLQPKPFWKTLDRSLSRR